jgi:hypothetical protein
MENNYCEVAPDERSDPERYRPCGKPACTRVEWCNGTGIWLCAEHYDRYKQVEAEREIILGSIDKL